MYNSEYKLINELDYYGLDFLIPVRMYRHEEEPGMEEFRFSNNYNSNRRRDDEEPDWYYDDEDDEYEGDDYEYDDEDEEEGATARYAYEKSLSESHSMVNDLDDLMEVFDIDHVDPEEILDMNIWDIFGISKKQFDMIDWSLIHESEFCEFLDTFKGMPKHLSIEKKILYSMTQVATGYLALTFYNRFGHSAQSIRDYCEHIVDTHSLAECKQLFSWLFDYYRFMDDAIEMNSRRAAANEQVFDYDQFPKPNRIKDLHDKAFRDHQFMETERAKEHKAQLNEDIAQVCKNKMYTQFLYQNDQFIVKPVTSQDDLEEEGEVLDHCVASYGSYMAQGNSYIYLIRKLSEPDKPLYTAEIVPPDPRNPKDKFRLNQCYGYKDTIDKSVELRNFIFNWTKAKNVSIRCAI